jgi:hypothetical protein
MYNRKLWYRLTHYNNHNDGYQDYAGIYDYSEHMKIYWNIIFIRLKTIINKYDWDIIWGLTEEEINILEKYSHKIRNSSTFNKIDCFSSLEQLENYIKCDICSNIPWTHNISIITCHHNI